MAVARLALHCGVNGWGPTTLNLPLNSPPDASLKKAAQDRTDLEKVYPFKLADLGAQAGDRITYYATAWDNHPHPAQSAETPVHTIMVVDQQTYDRYARSQYRMQDLLAEWRKFQDRLDKLEAQRKDILKKLDELQSQLEKGKPMTAAQAAQMRQLREQLDQYADQSLSLYQDFRKRIEAHQLYAFEAPYKQMLNRLSLGLQGQVSDASRLSQAMQQALQQALQQAGQTGQRGNPSASASVGEAAKRFKQNQAPFDQAQQEQRQQTTADLQKLALADQMAAQTQRIAEVVKTQQELASKLAEFRHAESLSDAQQLRASKLAAQQKQVRRELEDAQKQLRSLAAQAHDQLPKMSGSAEQLCAAIDQLDVDRDQREAQRLAEAGQGRYAHQAAQQAADKLASLVSSCNNVNNQSGDDLDGCLKLTRPSLSEAMQQMAQSRGLGMKSGKSGHGQSSGSGQPVAVLGPGMHAQQAAGRGPGTGQGGPRERHVTGDAESLSPEQATPRGGAGAVMSDVPEAYRSAAQAYLQRLDEDSSR